MPTPSFRPELTLDTVQDAARQIAGVAHRTPVVTSRTLNELTGAQVFLKCENLQRIGAFKFRGAYNVVSRLSDSELSRGVAAYSSGNHAQAVALAASLMGTSATILMPQDTPQAKVDATRGYGATVEFYDRYTGDRVALGNALAHDRGLTLVPPYEHFGVMAGQGTAALELLDEAGPFDQVIAPIGGGGLMAGTATVAKSVDARIRVVGVEPQHGNDTQLSLAAGRRVTIPVPHTIADGQGAEVPGELTFSITQQLVDAVTLVTDEQIVHAMIFAFDRLKLVLEPSGATSLAAILFSNGALRGMRVGAILSGGNVGADRFRMLTTPGSSPAAASTSPFGSPGITSTASISGDESAAR